MTELSALNRKRGFIKSKLTNFSKYITEFAAITEVRDADILQLENRISRVENLLDDFEQIQMEIQTECEETDLDQQLIESENFEKFFFSSLALAKELLNKNTKSDVLSRSSAGNEEGASVRSAVTMASEIVSNAQSIKLPPIPLPKFEGAYDSWLEYRDLFKSLIHEKPGLTDIEKFHHLRASLGGNAAQLIKSLQFSSSNYPIAWELLNERYNCTKLLVHNHVKELFNIPPITKESSVQIRRVVDTVNKQLRSLDKLEQPTSEWGTLLIYLIRTKLDDVSIREWERQRVDKTVPTFDEFLNFLQSRAEMLETLEIKSDKGQTRHREKPQVKAFVSTKFKCLKCKGDHYIQHCTDFLKLHSNDRVSEIKRLKLCINCLRPGHYANNCTFSTCKLCSGKHNSLLHLEKQKTDVLPEVEAISQTQENSDSTVAHTSIPNQVLLSTASIIVFDINNKPHYARVLLDSGSQTNLITVRFCDLLQLPKTKINLTISGISQTKSNIKFKCLTHIQSRQNNYQTSITCLLVPEITGSLPNFVVDSKLLRIPAHVKLADPGFCQPGQIDMLIGAELFTQLLCIGQLKASPEGAVLQKTKLGWIISGPVPSQNCNTLQCNFNEMALSDNLDKFWELEECSLVKPLSKEEMTCESHYVEHTWRDSNGRFVVSLPLKENISLGDSKDFALKRFYALERRLQANPILKERYVAFMDEYLLLNHMSEVDENNASTISYYMPHHGVVKETSTSTKLRVVFDGSAPSSNGKSLNNVLMVGPNIQDDLFSILIRFRIHSYVISADIEKMYRQVLVDHNDRNLQRILWRSDPKDFIKSYQLNTVTYGTGSASFLAIRSLFQVGLDCESEYPDISNIIKRDFYVDDLLTGGETVEQVTRIANLVSEKLAKACFPLRKWVANEPQIIQNICGDILSTNTIEFGIDQNTKTLGLVWNSNLDRLMYTVTKKHETKVTKRIILSEVSQIFDPLGLLSPCIITAKVIIQRLWLEKLSWDESVSSELHTKWLAYRDQLTKLNEIEIQRQATAKNAVTFELHGFSDASMSAFGGCVYIVSRDVQGRGCVQLLCAKSKVAPLKTQTVPRLELSGAVVLARLMHKAKSCIKLKLSKCSYWSDSTIVLGWLRHSPSSLQTFVGNRVAQVQELSDPLDWRHVVTDDNPADCLSRGVSPGELNSLKLWWHGPPWLSYTELNWPSQGLPYEELPELRKAAQSHVTVKVPCSLFEKYSSLTKLERVVAYCLRFMSNCLRKHGERQTGPLTVQELRNALHFLVKISQNESFPDDLKSLRNKSVVRPKGNLIALNPILDAEGIIRVGGRLNNSSFSYSKKHPIIIHSHHQFAKLLFIREHQRLLHAGPQLLLASIRENFWPILGRNLARKIVHSCVKCFRANPKIMNPIMGDLPRNRLEMRPPFFITGVDYAGPLLTVDRKGRGAKVSKCYICVFICFTTRAVHVEIVSDLTKEGFVAALRRFTSRRGKPLHIYSDNGLNFVGANSELQELGKFLVKGSADLIEGATNEGITWHFIPARAPHFGGLWEASVRSIKFHLKRVAGEARLTYEELNTLVVQIEAILNSRPLSPMSSDPHDLNPITPSHFLIGRPSNTVADPDLSQIPMTRLSRYQRVQQLNQHLWSRWAKEYVSELQVRTKWKQNTGALKLNDLVVVKEDHLPPQKWLLGRVVALHPGKDNVARVATLRTANGLIKRAFSKICPLPIDEVIPVSD